MSHLVSIIVPVYNAASTVRQTLDSVCRQTWDDLEVILVDDGSTDGSADIAETLDDDRITIIRTKNEGACQARNTGIDVAKGEFIQFLDADDFIAGNKIERQVRALLEGGDERAVAYGAWREFFDEPEDSKDGFCVGRTFSAAMELLFFSMAEGFYLPPHCWLVPACIVESAGGWDVRLLQNQDGEYFSRVLRVASAAIWVPDAISYYRKGYAVSVSSRKSRCYSESLLLAANLIRDRMLDYSGADVSRRALISALYLRILYRIDPSDRAMADRIWAEVDQLGLPPRSVPFGGRKFNLMKRYLGWRRAFKARELAAF